MFERQLLSKLIPGWCESRSSYLWKDNIEGIVWSNLGEKDEAKKTDNKEQNYFFGLLNVAIAYALCTSVLR